jgi:hypothetical protein
LIQKIKTKNIIRKEILQRYVCKNCECNQRHIMNACRSLYIFWYCDKSTLKR